MLLTFYIYRDSLLYNYILNSLRIIPFPALLRTLTHWLPIIIFLTLWIKFRIPYSWWGCSCLREPLLHQTGSILYHEGSIWYFCWPNQYLCGHSFLSWDELIRYNLSCAYNPNSIEIIISPWKRVYGCYTTYL